MKHLLKKTKIWYLLALCIIDVVFFSLTDPVTASSIILVTGFILLVITFYLGVSLLVEGFTIAPSKELSKNKKNFIVILTGVAAFLIAMQSIGQLSTSDVLAITSLGVLFFIYLAYLTTNKS